MRTHNNLPSVLEGHCKRCNIDTDFRYVSSTIGCAGQPERHFYSCECGETYTMDKLVTLRNAVKIVREAVR